jgi:DNA polymerase-1
MANDEKLINAFKEGQDIHALTASQVFGVPFDEVTPLQRRNAKAVNFGMIYGIGAYSLSQDIGVSVKEAEQYMKGYFEKYPNIKQFMDDCVENAKKTTKAVTLFGRTRFIPELASSNFVQRSFGERAAMNMPVQGTAADIIKIAMVRVHDKLKGHKSRLILQVHDELLIEAHKDELEEVRNMLKEEMENAVKLNVPLEVDVHTGNNWYEAK